MSLIGVFSVGTALTGCYGQQSDTVASGPEESAQAAASVDSVREHLLQRLSEVVNESEGVTNVTAADQAMALDHAVAADQAVSAQRSVSPSLGLSPLVIASEDIRLEIAPQTSRGVLLKAISGPEIAFHIPGAERRHKVESVLEGVVKFGGAIPSADILVQALPQGTRMMTFITGKDAPVEYRFALDLPEGSELQADGSGGISILDANGDGLATVAPPWGIDANGEIVPTAYTIEEHTIVLHDLELDSTAHSCRRAGQEIALTAREFALLEMLIRRKGEVLAKQRILELVWGLDFAGDPNVVEVYVGYLRRKIDVPFGRQNIQTLRGVGYRLREQGCDV